MTENVEQTGCPSFDDISAYLDGEADSSVNEHISTCKSCQHVLASLQILDSAVGKACRPPVGLSERVMTACQEDEEQAVSPAVVPFWGRSLVRYAAAIVLTLGLAAAVRTTVRGPADSKSDAGTQIASVNTSQAQAGEKMARPVRPVVINDEQVAPVSVVDNQTSEGQRMPAPQRVLGRTVSHVWGMPNLANVKSEFQAQLPDGMRCGMDRKNDQDVVFDVKLTDRQLQKLVDSMHAKGWVLFSPQLPQPGQSKLVQLNGSPVLYQAQFIPVKKQQ